MLEGNAGPEGDGFGPDTSQHSAPAMPSQPAGNSPPSGQMGSGEPSRSGGAAAGLKEEHKENEVNNFSRCTLV